MKPTATIIASFDAPTIALERGFAPSSYESIQFCEWIENSFVAGMRLLCTLENGKKPEFALPYALSFGMEDANPDDQSRCEFYVFCEDGKRIFDGAFVEVKDFCDFGDLLWAFYKKHDPQILEIDVETAVFNLCKPVIAAELSHA